MNDFIQKLAELRQGTMQNMKRGPGQAMQDVAEATAARDEAMKSENFPNPESYPIDMNNPQDQELFTPTYAKVGQAIGKAGQGIGDFIQRLLNLRK